MNTSTGAAESRSRVRPVGVLNPDDERAVRAMRAIEERRFDDAARLIRTMPDAPLVARFWKTLLTALERGGRSRLADAEQYAWQALGMATAVRQSSDAVNETTDQRMIARALNLLGTLYRRQERAAEAARLHRAAYLLRSTYGSIEEQWDSLIEWALDADVLGAMEEATDRMNKAALLAVDAQEAPLAKQAIAWTHLSRMLGAAARHDEAIDAARTARRLWHEYDPAAATAVQADVRLGGALIAAAASGASDRKCRLMALEEAESLLADAASALQAFGASYDTESHWARERYDFAKRLLKELR